MCQKTWDLEKFGPCKEPDLRLESRSHVIRCICNIFWDPTIVYVSAQYIVSESAPGYCQQFFPDPTHCQQILAAPSHCQVFFPSQCQKIEEELPS